MIEYEERVISVIVVRKGDPIFVENTTTIAIVDEAGGEFIKISQCTDSEDQELRFDTDEWPVVRDAASKMADRCRKEKA